MRHTSPGRTRNIAALFLALLLASAGNGGAKTITQGRIEFNRLSNTLKAEMGEYQKQHEAFAEDVRSLQISLGKLRADYRKAASKAERMEIKALTAKETSRLIEAYSRMYALAISHVEAVIPKLEKMRKVMRTEGVNGRIQRELKDPELIRGLNITYTNISALGRLLGTRKNKVEIAGLLKSNAALYAQTDRNGKQVGRLVRRLEQMTEFFHTFYAQAVSNSMILTLKKEQTRYSVQLMMHALDLEQIRKKMPKFTDMLTALPDISMDEFLDDPELFGEEAGETVTGGLETVYDTDADSVLESFRNGVIQTHDNR